MQSDLVLFVFSLVVLICSVVLHELAHGYAAKALGDDTAERTGRLTLNPLVHLDPVGSVLVPILLTVPALFGGPVLPGFAWAKPVPFNPANLYKDRQYGPLKVALAGPATNLLLVVIFGLAARIAGSFGYEPAFAGFTLVTLINAALAILNLVPVPPFDGFRLVSLVSRDFSDRLERLGPGSILLALLVVYLAGDWIFEAAVWLAALVIGS